MDQKLHEWDNLKDLYVKIFSKKNLKNKIRETKDKIGIKKQEEFDLEEKILVELINSTAVQWKTSIANYEHAVENDVIDYYAYIIKAYELKYEYLIKKAKKMGIKVELFKNFAM